MPFRNVLTSFGDRMPDIFDQHADNYSDTINKSLRKFGTSHDFFMAHKATILEELSKRHGVDQAKTRLLDVGCGTGQLHDHLSGKYLAIEGVDVSKESIRVAAENRPANCYTTYDGHRLPYENAKFDLVIAIAVFHHVHPSAWQSTADEMLRVTRPGGLSIVIEPNPFNPITRYIVNTCDLDKNAILVRPSQLRNIFARAGCAYVYTHTVMSVPPINFLLRHLDYLLGYFPFGAQYYLVAQSPALSRSSV